MENTETLTTLTIVEGEKGLQIAGSVNNYEELFLDKANFLGIIRPIRERVENLIADVHTAEGVKIRKSLNRQIASIKNEIENKGKEVAAELKAKPKKIDATRKAVKDTLEELQNTVMAPIVAIEARKAEIEEIKSIAAEIPGKDSQGIAMLMDKVMCHEHDLTYWDESWDESQAAIDNVMAQLKNAHAAAEKAEADARELERLRSQQAEAERIMREKAEAERKAAEAELAKARAEAEAAKKAQFEAEVRADKAEKAMQVDMGEADARKTRDNMLFPDDEANYKRMVNREVLEDLMKYDISEPTAKRLITDIVRGKVRHVRVMYQG